MKYLSSKGAIEISTMILPHAQNALNKLRRDAPERKEEIAALAAHVEKLEAEPAPVGHNNPPEEKSTPTWDAVKVQMDDLLTEARNWADGEAISSQKQADAVAGLRQLLQDASNLADKARVAEKEPYDKVISEIQERYNEYIAPLKNKKPGSVPKAVQALGNMLQPWLKKLEDEKKERERIAAQAAEDAQRKALEARQEAKKSDDLSAMDFADELLDAAEDAAQALKSVERESVHAQGAFRAQGLRSKWVAVFEEGGGRDALIHFAKAEPHRVKEFLQGLADEAVRKGARSIPGFVVKEERVI